VRAFSFANSINLKIEFKNFLVALYALSVLAHAEHIAG
jgi:hypothetical protein